jgi:hypothetical protein
MRILDRQIDSGGSPPRPLIRREGAREGEATVMRDSPPGNAKAEWEARPARDTDIEVTTPSGLTRLPRFSNFFAAQRAGR